VLAGFPSGFVGEGPQGVERRADSAEIN